MNENQISEIIIGCAIEVHKNLGPGLLESVYEECLAFELRKLGLRVERQKRLPLIYKGVDLESGLRLDMLVEDKVIVENKSVESLHNVYIAQILTYLKLSDKKLGLILNFNVERMKDGIKRYVNNL